MSELLLLTGDLARARNDNHIRIQRAFRQIGWTVTRADHDSVEVAANRILLAGREPSSFDLIWPLGFGRQVTFFDRMQLLGQLPAHRFVTTPQAMANLHGKHHWLTRMPETHTSSSPDRLHALILSGGDWVVKPPAGSYGRDVTVFRAGNADRQALEALFRAVDGGYLMAQRYLPDIESGEKRTLVAGGEPVGTYLRVPQHAHLANLAAGGSAGRAELSEAESAMILALARELAGLGVGFAAIDTVGERLMEVNVANPGGLQTLETLYGRDVSSDTVRAILRWRQLDQ